MGSGFFTDSGFFMGSDFFDESYQIKLYNVGKSSNFFVKNK